MFVIDNSREEAGKYFFVEISQSIPKPKSKTSNEEFFRKILPFHFIEAYRLPPDPFSLAFISIIIHENDFPLIQTENWVSKVINLRKILTKNFLSIFWAS